MEPIPTPLAAVSLGALTSGANSPIPVSSDPFVAGQDGVHTYRIPAVVLSPSGAVLVFCEARRESIRDASPTDMVLRRSLDDGATWLPIQTLVRGEGTDALMNPVAVVDHATGTVLLLCCNTNRATRGEHRRHLLLSSRDDGTTWSGPVDLGSKIADYDDTFVPGPGCGIQTRSGRLVVPGYTSPETIDARTESGFRSRVLYSDDHGQSWRMGQPVDSHTNESQVVELTDGRLLLNMRQGTGQCCRAVAVSDNGGESWGPVSWDRTLNECPCQASILRHSSADSDGRSIVLFANPDNAGERFGVIERTRMTVRLSYDEGRTWPVKKLIHGGPSSYSGLVRFPNGDVGLVFEGGEAHRREWIRFCRLPLAWLTAAPAVGYPGPAPGLARGTASATDARLENDAISMEWDFHHGGLRSVRLVHRQTDASLDLAGTECFILLLGQTPFAQPRPLRASALALVAPPELKRLEADPTAARLGDRFNGWELSACLTCEESGFDVTWRSVLRDEASYIRQKITVLPHEDPVELSEVILIDLRAPGAAVAGRVEGSPVVTDTLFFGVEHPASRSQVLDTDRVCCSYPYNLDVRKAEPLTLSAVLGVVPPGQLRRGFLHYLERERAQPYRPCLHHNNGEQIGLAYWNLRGDPRFAAEGKGIDRAAELRADQERLWRELIEQVGHELVELRGACIDAFAHDYEWDDETLVWQFHDGFPDGFRPLVYVAARYGADLGIWFSPWGGYSGKPTRVECGRTQALETNQGGLSLAGSRHYARFRAACVNLMRDHGVRYYKFDGIAGSNSPAGAGEYRSDIEALWRLMGELREKDPGVFLNPSSGTWASPFWLLRADSIWRGGGDAGIAGAKGSARQQWITYRDFEVRNRVMANGPLFPISSLMIHGIMVSGTGRVKSFVEQDMIDEIRSFFATGVNCQELYVSPELMTEAAWDALAEAAKWARANADVLADTHWIGGDPAQSEVYGWAAWTARKGILSLRNPSDQAVTFELTLASAFELPAAAEKYTLHDVWGSRPDLHGTQVGAAQRVCFDVSPFEVITMEAIPV